MALTLDLEIELELELELVVWSVGKRRGGNLLCKLERSGNFITIVITTITTTGNCVYVCVMGSVCQIAHYHML